MKYLTEQKLEYSPQEWSIDQSFIARLMRQEGAVWDMGFVIHGGGAVRSLQVWGNKFNSIVYQQKIRDAPKDATTNPPFLLSSDVLCCNKLD